MPISKVNAQTDLYTVNSQNSQNIALLQAAVFPSLDLVKTGGDITIENHSALLPEVGPLGTASDIKSEYLSDEIVNYIVRKGDTIGAIAKMFNISQNTIIWANDLKKDQALSEGDSLVILPVSGVEYFVKKGDTLRGIANKFSADVGDIGVFNGITEETVLAIGDQIIIPDGEISSVSSGQPRPKTNSYSGPEFAGYYMRPITGGRKTQGIHGHNGVDLANYVGAPVMAAADGTVIISRNSGWNGGYGKYVVITHKNGTQTLYSHLNGTNVPVGAKVKQGETIGFLGNTGKSTGPHLHFEIRGAKNPF
jgi:murein DD-endopeptidase MepM/ murein hydrolase activator NlpD